MPKVKNLALYATSYAYHYKPMPQSEVIDLGDHWPIELSEKANLFVKGKKKSYKIRLILRKLQIGNSWQGKHFLSYLRPLFKF